MMMSAVSARCISTGPVLLASILGTIVACVCSVYPASDQHNLANSNFQCRVNVGITFTW